MFFGKDAITTGASNDFQRATRIITDMIVKYGMDPDIGTLSYADDSEGYTAYKPYSEKTAQMIDEKVHSYMKQCYAQSLSIIVDNKTLMESMARVLLAKEYITREEFEQMMADPASVDAILSAHEAAQKKLLAEAKKIIKN